MEKKHLTNKKTVPVWHRWPVCQHGCTCQSSFSEPGTPSLGRSQFPCHPAPPSHHPPLPESRQSWNITNFTWYPFLSPLLPRGSWTAWPWSFSLLVLCSGEVSKWSYEPHLPQLRSHNLLILTNTLCCVDRWKVQWSWVWFQPSNDCNWPIWLQLISLIIHQHAQLFILKVLRRIHQSFTLLLSAAACGPGMAATLQAFQAACYLGCSDWLKQLSQLAAWGLLSSTRSWTHLEALKWTNSLQGGRRFGERVQRGTGGGWDDGEGNHIWSDSSEGAATLAAGQIKTV